ncbi:nucleoside diphosphate kinase [Pavlovales sp. CCMP2436]|nr:nucleoside diphosphate kinase [Pavlovales sp. CCMP2436]|mmetsp:Transcript_76/g.196  ORF Transcript_76/g.196 Transcript_76/m.196 type:complete len:340 (-) Transcript_76:220-1239(-)
MSIEQRYTFFAQYYDPSAALVRVYQLVYYTDNAIEIFDMKNRRTFLKRMKFTEIALRDLFVGNTVTIHSRQFKVTEYGDRFTAERFAESSETAVALVLPAAIGAVPQLLKTFAHSGLIIAEVRMCEIPPQCPGYTQQHAGFAVAILLKAAAAISTVSQIAAASGGAFTAPESHEEAGMAAAMLFGERKPPLTAPVCQDSTLLLVRPHALKAGMLGDVLDLVTKSGFVIRTMSTFTVSLPNAEEFLEVYKGVIPEYREYVDELSSGVCFAAEVTYSPAPHESVRALRELAGAPDPEVARLLQKQSIRALFSQSKVKNCVHCTDLPEDGPLEVEYFFSTLA